MQRSSIWTDGEEDGPGPVGGEEILAAEEEGATAGGESEQITIETVLMVPAWR